MKIGHGHNAISPFYTPLSCCKRKLKRYSLIGHYIYFLVMIDHEAYEEMRKLRTKYKYFENSRVTSHSVRLTFIMLLNIHALHASCY